MATKRVSVKIHGEVQGVGFRYFTRELAREFGIVGWVRNVHDDTVEVTAEGEEGRLARFVGMLREGPSRAEVESVDVEWLPPTGEFDRFYART